MAQPLKDQFYDSIAMTERFIELNYGDQVSCWARSRPLNKFGRNESVSTSWETVSEFQGVTEETYVTTNLIDTIVSSSASDTQDITVSGHTIDGSGNLTLVTQTSTLAGTTPVPLVTPLARASRMFIAPSGAFGTTPAAAVGSIAVYDDTDGATAGVPDTDAAVKMLIIPGESQSAKCETSTATDEYWILTGFDVAVTEPAAQTGTVTFKIETRDIANGGAWRPLGREAIALADVQNPTALTFNPPRIVRPNHDVRARAITDAATAPVYAEISGWLAVVLSDAEAGRLVRTYADG